MKKNQKYRKQRQTQAMRSTVIGVVLLLAGFVLFLVLQGSDNAAASDTTSRSVIPVEVEFVAPALQLENVNGKTEALQDFSGQVVLVNNWATWCPPCKAEMPSLEKYYQAHKEEGFTIVAISAGDTQAEVEQFTQSYGLTFNFWLDPDGAALNAFRNGSLPSSYVLDRNGTVRLAWTGEISLEMLEKYVTPLVQSVN
ncbi:MAG: TlpA family protein disulfide reductase [Anaerolineales bacterium]|nr:TlpA family protein disulfide reductase [Anaerolineales bacterium]MCB9144176.1 TlpA family protein disulfide reductase [Anaerolineales bacterium]